MISIWEHFGLFVLLSLLVTLVYSGLRQDDLGVIVRVALKRFVFFMGISAVFAVGVFFFASAL